ncbi:cytochrome c oxidase subunit 2 [Nocardioides lianchengensis]|uniref:cytochrome-c oxidase n=2 Tax=Nocardioides lianchengensis TaxID=1045774 RepID=A0A1G6MXQ3_9ACTN|nr:cytochrome c oxidase subunit 2 [Nocardioides lianchengensis]
MLGVSVVALAGCGSESQSEWKRLAMPEPATKQGESTLALWQGAWIAALITGVVVWGLIAWVVIRYRRRSDDEIPIQTRYNLPLEIFYTIAPIMMVVVFFQQTVETQNVMLHRSAEPDNIVEVTAQQWSWAFNHGVGEVDYTKDEKGENDDDEFPYSEYAYVSGTGSDIPSLYLPVDRTTRFNLHSPDVIHDFGVPGFLMKMDVIPGRVNTFEVTPKTEGVYAGKCYELCGVYHSRMLFEVHVVSGEEYDAYVEDLATRASSEKPLIGGDYTRTQVGLDTEESAEHEGAAE